MDALLVAAAVLALAFAVTNGLHDASDASGGIVTIAPSKVFGVIAERLIYAGLKEN